ncbi:MAG: hypothetical protein ACI4GZ_05815 [Ruminococcus sp.]
MKKTVSVFCAVLLAVSMLAGCGISENKQLRIIAENPKIWQETTVKNASVYGYVITDLDQNGRYELIAATNYGKENTTESKYFEISEDGKSLSELPHEFEGEGLQADVMAGSAKCYVDGETGQLFYIFEDNLFISVRETYITKVAVSLFEGKVTEEILAKKATIYPRETDIAEITYTDAEGNEISEADFENIADVRFNGFEKKKATFGWVGYSTSNYTTLTNMSYEELLAILKDSKASFSID